MSLLFRIDEDECLRDKSGRSFWGKLTICIPLSFLDRTCETTNIIAKLISLTMIINLFLDYDLSFYLTSNPVDFASEALFLASPFGSL